MEFDEKHVLFKHPATILVGGPTGCGKTYFVRDIIKYHKDLFYIKEQYEIFKVLWCYGQWQELYKNKIDHSLDIDYIDGFPEKNLLSLNSHHLIVIDDLMNELGKNLEAANLFTKVSHHLNISVVFITQNIFHQSPVMRTISLNCHYMIHFNNPRDKQQINNLSRQIFPSNSKFLIQAYEEATEKPYKYIKVDLSPDTPNILRVSGDIIPQNNIFNPTIYVPKNV